MNLNFVRPISRRGSAVNAGPAASQSEVQGMLLSVNDGPGLKRTLTAGRKVNDPTMWKKERRLSQSYKDETLAAAELETDKHKERQQKLGGSTSSVNNKNDYLDELLQYTSGRRDYSGKGDSSDFQFSVSVVGDASSFKSKILASECGEHKRHNYMTGKTTDIEFKRNSYEFEGKVTDVNYWISNTSSKNLSLTAKLMARSAATVYVFNVDDADSFENISSWIQYIDESSQKRGSDEILYKRPALLLANNIKMGLQDEDATKVSNENDDDSSEDVARSIGRVVSETQGLDLAQKYGLLYYECSSENPETFKKVFSSLIHLVIEPFLYLDKSSNPAVMGLVRGGVFVHINLTPQQRVEYLQSLTSARPKQEELTSRLDWDI